VLSSGFVAGQVVGGVLVTANLFGQSWRPVFLVNVPIGLAVLALVPLVMPADEPGQHRRRLDLTGLAIAVPAVFLVILPLMLGHQENWPGWVFACMVGGVVLAAVFAGVERRIADRAALAFGFSPLVTHALVRVPLAQAADASGLLTTTIQLGQAIGVATFGSLFLTLDSAPGPTVSGRALAVTFGWLAAAMVLAVAAGIPLARTAAAAGGRPG
jgi:MFS family permease